jgi:prepilin-type N-terminal cleavage/methylation domain-containing protein
MKLNQKGFSLLEVLIAITLLSFVMLAILSVTENSTVTKERVSKEDRESLQIETAMAKLKWDFIHIYTPLFSNVRMQFSEDEEELQELILGRFRENRRFEGPDYDGKPIPLYENDRQSFEFYTAGNRRKYQDQKESRFAWVKYTVETVKSSMEEGEDTKALVRYYSAKNPYGNERLDTSKIKPQVLLEGIESVKFFYWDPKNRRFQDSLDLVEEGTTKIRGLKVEISWKDSADFVRKTVRIFRALFPDFQPEDPYKLIEEQIKAEENEEKKEGDAN